MPSNAQMVEVEGRRLRLTNLDKVLYPATGTTKGEVIAYYSQVAERMLPVLADRPVTRKRWVHGVGTGDAAGESFFVKQLEAGAPDWIRRERIEHSDGPKDYPVIDSVAALVHFAQVASLELHVPQWRFGPEGQRLNPDRLVLDLDPGPGVDLAQCAHIARLARAILQDIGLQTVPVTSGSKGIHLYAPLDGSQTSDQASALAKELAKAIETDHPDLATSTMAKAARGGKVFLDWSQNNGAKTTIAPYSLRGRLEPTVAAPRTWEELDDPGLRHLRFDEIADRTVVFGLDGERARTPSKTTRPTRTAAPKAAKPKAAPSKATPRRESTRIPASTTGAPSPSEPAAEPLTRPAPMLAENGTAGLARSIRGAWAEIKWDGIRAVGSWQGGRMLLHARSGTDITARYPELTADGAPHLAASDAVVDGEIVAFDASGRPSFHRLQNRMHLTRGREIEREVVRTPVQYCLFDLLSLNGHDLTGVPLRERRALLETLIESAEGPVVVPPVFDDVDAALSTSADLGLEGVVVKDPASRYRPGARSASWMKIKHTLTQEAVVIGIRPGKGDRAGTIGSLLLAVPDDERRLRYVGRVGSGFTDRILADLEKRLDPLRADEAAAEDVPRADARDALWVRPELVGEVEFANWTPDGSLRHARWRGLRPDKRVDEVVRES